MSKELIDLDLPIREIEPYLTNFANKYKYVLHNIHLQDTSVREISVSIENVDKGYLLHKSIGLHPDNWERPANYKIVALIYTSYGIMRSLITIISILRGKQKMKHFRKEIEIASFEDKIDPERLRDALEKAKKTLDEFDNSSIILTLI